MLLSLDDEEVIGLLLVDFKKAFDLVSHQLLLTKLHACGVSEKCVEWFKSYLLDRCQFVSINGMSSHEMCIQSKSASGFAVGSITFHHLH